MQWGWRQETVKRKACMSVFFASSLRFRRTRCWVTACLVPLSCWKYNPLLTQYCARSKSISLKWFSFFWSAGSSAFVRHQFLKRQMFCSIWILNALEGRLYLNRYIKERPKNTWCLHQECLVASMCTSWLCSPLNICRGFPQCFHCSLLVIFELWCKFSLSVLTRYVRM